MPSQVQDKPTTEPSPTVDSAYTAVLEELFAAPAVAPSSQWCDLTPDVQLTPADGNGPTGERSIF